MADTDFVDGGELPLIQAGPIFVRRVVLGEGKLWVSISDGLKLGIVSESANVTRGQSRSLESP
jgi:hypothetical protein